VYGLFGVCGIYRSDLPVLDWVCRGGNWNPQTGRREGDCSCYLL